MTNNMTNISSEDIDIIKRKIASLQRLHDSAVFIGSQAEAEAAACMIQKLLLKYNLNLKDEGEAPSGQDAIFTHENHRLSRMVANGQWLRALRGTVCKYTFCLSISSASASLSYEIYGKPDNVSTAVWLIDYLSQYFSQSSMLRYARYSWGCLSNGRMPVGHKSFRHDYLAGCVKGLEENFKQNCESRYDEASLDKKRHRKDNDSISPGVETSTAMALVIRTQSNLRDYVTHCKGKSIPKATIDIETSCETAEILGQKDGREISLLKQISG